jgi:hypothetical protein
MVYPTETDVLFVPEHAVATYRGAIARRDAARTHARRAEFQAFANRLRESWKDLHGEDSLHDLAFGALDD